MSAEAASALVAALQAHGVAARVGGGWAVDALVGNRPDHTRISTYGSMQPIPKIYSQPSLTRESIGSGLLH
jgi:hypothetical protein